MYKKDVATADVLGGRFDAASDCSQHSISVVTTSIKSGVIRLQAKSLVKASINLHRLIQSIRARYRYRRQGESIAVVLRLESTKHR